MFTAPTCSLLLDSTAALAFTRGRNRSYLNLCSHRFAFHCHRSTTNPSRPIQLVSARPYAPRSLCRSSIADRTPAGPSYPSPLLLPTRLSYEAPRFHRGQSTRHNVPVASFRHLCGQRTRFPGFRSYAFPLRPFQCSLLTSGPSQRRPLDSHAAPVVPSCHSPAVAVLRRPSRPLLSIRLLCIPPRPLLSTSSDLMSSRSRRCLCPHLDRDPTRSCPTQPLRSYVVLRRPRLRAPLPPM